MQESNCVPVAVFEEAQRAIFHLLPVDSREHYEKVFAEFNEWREKRGVMTINKEVMLSYFLNLKKKYAVSSLWSKYSMLKATIKVYKNTDIGKYSCTHNGDFRCLSMLRSGKFEKYMNQKCTSQPVGINTLAKVPSIVASFLNLSNAELYTGHCMRRTSTSLLANKGADLTTIKRDGGWKSSAIAESYIEDSISNKLDIVRKVQEESNVTRSENDGNNPLQGLLLTERKWHFENLLKCSMNTSSD
ncbi:hypothetical protein NQ315_008888 [Exocentrus adspersus]|uniref:Tyr recombinase domain-containing protein n=1 Tax=Exocentrus adspersus TaxID=1586481 RepID=A0AAV8V9N5_9CUCU|nr:hypothetical protein NQ315_008888 [Exocentrus adspersus]